MKKELRPIHDHVACDVCGRTILKGENTEAYVSPDGRRHEVCDLCFSRAGHQGWIRESTAAEVPRHAPRLEPRRSILGRLRRRRGEPAPETAAAPAAEGHSVFREPEPLEVANGADPAEPEPEPASPPPRRRTRPKDPRHVRAVPTTYEGKVERALDLFNGSDHQRTVAGLGRTLGPAWVAAVPDQDQPSSVVLVVAWELSWYRFRIDLGDDADPVALVENGEEIDQIDEPLREWNATLDADGRVVAGHAVAGGGSAER